MQLLQLYVSSILTVAAIVRKIDTLMLLVNLIRDADEDANTKADADANAYSYYNVGCVTLDLVCIGKGALKTTHTVNSSCQSPQSLSLSKLLVSQSKLLVPKNLLSDISGLK